MAGGCCYFAAESFNVSGLALSACELQECEMFMYSQGGSKH